MTEYTPIIDHLNYKLLQICGSIIIFIIGFMAAYYKMVNNKLDRAEFDKFKEMHNSEHTNLRKNIEDFQLKLELSVRRIEDKF